MILTLTQVYHLLAPLGVCLWKEGNNLLIPPGQLPSKMDMVKWRRKVYDDKTNRIGNARDYNARLDVGPVMLCNAFPRRLEVQGVSSVIVFDYAKLIDPLYLLWCPCCGGEAMTERTIIHMTIRCTVCKLVLSKKTPCQTEDEWERLIEQWNTRKEGPLPKPLPGGKVPEVTVHIRKPDATPHRTKTRSQPKARKRKS